MSEGMVPSTPDPEMQTLVLTAIRAVLTILGTFGITWGASVSQAAWQIVAGAVVLLGGVAWSFWQKFHQARLDHLGSVQSAMAGTPLKATAASGG